MHLRSVIAVAVAGGLAAATNALLLPPDIPDNEVISTLPIAESPSDLDRSLFEAYGVLAEQTVNLKCPGCLRAHFHPKKPTNPKGGDRKAEQKPELLPLRGKHEHGHVPGHHKGKKPPHKEVPSHLKLDFTVEQTNAGDILAVNGYELYPNPDPSRPLPLAAVLPDRHPMHRGKQEPKDALDDLMNHASHVQGIPEHAWRPLGFGMHSYSVPTTDMGDASLVNVELQIMEVGDVFVEGIPDVVVTLVQTSSGKLAMAKIDTIERSAESPLAGQKECSTMLCRWKAMLLGPFRKGCGRKGAGQHPPQPPSRQGHHGHEHRHGPIRFLVKFIVNIVLPVVVGIVAGIFAGFIGMVIGTAMVYVWRFFFRRGSNGHGCRYARRCKKQASATAQKAKLQDATAEDEKAGLMVSEEDIEAPPAYVEKSKGQIEI